MFHAIVKTDKSVSLLHGGQRDFWIGSEECVYVGTSKCHDEWAVWVALTITIDRSRASPRMKCNHKISGFIGIFDINSNLMTVFLKKPSPSYRGGAVPISLLFIGRRDQANFQICGFLGFNCED